MSIIGSLRYAMRKSTTRDLFNLIHVLGMGMANPPWYIQASYSYLSSIFTLYQHIWLFMYYSTREDLALS